MKLTARDTLHISSVKADNIRPGEAFEVSDAEGHRLIGAGLATEAVAASAAKKATAPANKKAAAPANKAGAAPDNKAASRKRGR